MINKILSIPKLAIRRILEKYKVWTFIALFLLLCFVVISILTDITLLIVLGIVTLIIWLIFFNRKKSKVK